MDTEAVLDGLKCAGAVIVLGSALGAIAGGLWAAHNWWRETTLKRAALREQRMLAGERDERLPDWYTGAADIRDIDEYDTQPQMPAPTWGPLDAMGYPEIPVGYGLGPETLVSVGATYLTLDEIDALKRRVWTCGEYREHVAERTAQAVYEWMVREGGEE